MIVSAGLPRHAADGAGDEIRAAADASRSAELKTILIDN